MSNAVKYRPWKLYIYIIPIVIFCGLTFIVIAGLCFSTSLTNFCISLLLGTLSFGLAKVLYDSYKVIILFSPQMIEITERKCTKKYQTAEFSYGYYGRGYKGHLYLVLSSTSLNKEQVKHLCNKGSVRSKICFDDAIVVPIDNTETKKEIEKAVDNKLLIIQE